MADIIGVDADGNPIFGGGYGDYVPPDQTTPNATVDPAQMMAANQQVASVTQPSNDPLVPTSVASSWGNENNANPNSVAQTQQAVAAAGENVPNDFIDNMLGKLGAAGSGLNSWSKGNPLLAYAALSGLAGAQKGEQARQAAAQLQTDKIATLDHEAQIARDKIAANSASVTGINPVQGIIANQLQRLNGNQVFQPNGRIVV
jgi:hypothetical protein